ncbi:MAG: exodeoxyribonuclease VII small subunit [Verrucomicrobiota bacterium JB023]|nr:exodeoxyribonuclease VII small subunit [Verrucomicrobiota bacterium JB023]
MPKKKQPEIPFEEAMEKLEELVSEMETDQLPLEKLILHYEEGNRLLQHCQSLLESARERIELVRVNETKTKNRLASDDSADKTSNSDATADDIRLF